MVAFKLFRKLKNGELRPLFIDRKRKLVLDSWLQADLVETKGFKVRKGWHCLPKPEAEHLSKKDRVWCAVEILEVEEIERPKNQGGTWFLAQKMKIVREL